MSPHQVIIIFGAGTNVGLATAKNFAKGGYQVAAISRQPSQELKKVARLILAADLKEPSQVEFVFDRVLQQLGVAAHSIQVLLHGARHGAASQHAPSQSRRRPNRIQH